MVSHLKALTGLRFIAAFMVVMYHFGRPKAPLAFHNVIAHGFVAVTLFFVLSGFILSYSYSNTRGEMKVSSRDFWVARLARIYPVYLLGFLLFTPYVSERLRALGVADSQNIGAYGAAALGLAQAWLTACVGVWNPPSWSLSAEAFFYLMFPFIGPYILALSRRRLIIAAIIFWLLSLSAQLMHALGHHLSQDFWAFNPLLRFPEFLLGIVLGRFWMIRVPGRFDAYAPILSVLAMGGLFAVLALDIDEDWFLNGPTAPIMMLLIYSLAMGRGRLAKVLASKPLVLLGESSYSLYILHWPLWLLIGGYLSDDLHLPKSAVFVIYAVLAVAASILSFKLLEQPANKFIRRKLSSKNANSSAWPNQSKSAS